MLDNWKRIDKIESEILGVAREQLHHAVQLPGMAGRSFSTPDAGDAFGNLGWSNAIAGFISHPLFSGQYYFGLSLPQVELSLLNGQQEVIASTPMQNLNMDEGLHWIKKVLADQGLDGSALHGSLPYDIPDYEENHRFILTDQGPYQQFSDLYANTDVVLSFLKLEYDNVTEHRCWPHHFDLAALRILEAHDNPEEEKSIGWGFSPGDSTHNEPYFYVNCWPYPQIDSLPSLAAGEWNKTGWVGTLLPYASFAGSPSQQDMAKAYFTSSIESLEYLMTKS